MRKRPSTALQQDRIITSIELLIASSPTIRKSQLHQFVSKTYGLGSRQADTYISRARRRLEFTCGKTTEEIRRENLLALTSIRDSIIGQPITKIRAIEVLNSMHGLDAPKRAEVTAVVADRPRVVVMLPSSPRFDAAGGNGNGHSKVEEGMARS
jgi:hypothetical protein